MSWDGVNKRERAQQIADRYDNDAYSVALAMIEREDRIQAKLDAANTEISRLSLVNTFEKNSIENSAIIKAADWLHNNYAHEVGSAAIYLHDYIFDEN